MAVKRGKFEWICPRCGFHNLKRYNRCHGIIRGTGKHCGFKKPHTQVMNAGRGNGRNRRWLRTRHRKARQLGIRA